MIQELILTKENIGFYLFLRDFLSINEFSKEFYKVKVFIERNLSFQLVHKNGKKFFIKQLCHEGDHDKAAFAFEMAFYEACASNPTFMPLADLVPRLYKYDPLYGIAVSELLEGYQPLTPATGNPQAVAEALVRVAQVPVRTHNNDQRPELMNPHHLKNKTPELISGNEDVIKAIVQLNKKWRPGNVLHNDLKPGNILTNKHYVVKIIDWEKMSTGDALWDLAALIYYSFPSDPSIYHAATASAEYLNAQSTLLKLITGTYRERWTKGDAMRLTQYLGLQILTVMTESPKPTSDRTRQLAMDLLLTPEQYLSYMFRVAD